jgi:hypothetical protein
MLPLPGTGKNKEKWVAQVYGQTDNFGKCQPDSGFQLLHVLYQFEPNKLSA